jgi:hypothetical protein
MLIVIVITMVCLLIHKRDEIKLRMEGFSESSSGQKCSRE